MSGAHRARPARCRGRPRPFGLVAVTENKSEVPSDQSTMVDRLLGVKPLGVRQTLSPDAWFVDLPGDRCVVLKRPGWRNRSGSPRVEAWIYNECERQNIRARPRSSHWLRIPSA